MSDNLGELQAILASLRTDLDYVHGLIVGIRGNIQGATIVANAAAGTNNKNVKKGITKQFTAGQQLMQIESDIVRTMTALASYIAKTRG